MSKTKSLHHIVFATKRRESTITLKYKRELYAYIFGILENKKCFLHKMNGVSDHIHILIDLHPSVALSDLVKVIKQSTTQWLRESHKFPMFDKWNEGYYAVSLGVDGLESCKKYIEQQETHHLGQNTVTEMHEMAVRNGLEWYPDDWE